MKLRNLALITITTVASAAYAQSQPSEVTDAQITKYKQMAQAACREGGKQHGDPEAKVNAFCNCMIETLDKSVTQKEWQQAYFYSSKQQGEEEAKILQPHLEKLSVCQARE